MGCPRQAPPHRRNVKRTAPTLQRGHRMSAASSHTTNSIVKYSHSVDMPDFGPPTALVGHL